MEITSSPTREKYPLSFKKITKKTITGTIGWSFLLLIFPFSFGFPLIGVAVDTGMEASAVLIIILISLFVLTGMIVVIAILSYLYQQKYFEVYFYDFKEDYLVIKKGVIAPKEITIPWERIQDVYVDQDVFDRMFGLYDVHVSTATITPGLQAHIDGVEKEAADGLRAALLEKVKSRISKK